jgi:hypothetical protein
MLRQVENVAASERVREDDCVSVLILNQTLEVFQTTRPDSVRMVDALPFLNERADHFIADALSHHPRLVGQRREGRHFQFCDYRSQT